MRAPRQCIHRSFPIQDPTSTGIQGGASRVPKRLQPAGSNLTDRLSPCRTDRATAPVNKPCQGKHQGQKLQSSQKSLENYGLSGRVNKGRKRAFPEEMSVTVLFPTELTHDLPARSHSEQPFHTHSKKNVALSSILSLSRTCEAKRSRPDQHHERHTQHGATRPRWHFENAEWASKHSQWREARPEPSPLQVNPNPCSRLNKCSGPCPAAPSASCTSPSTGPASQGHRPKKPPQLL